MKRFARSNIWGARAPRPLFSAPRRKILSRCENQMALREAHNAASEALAVPNALYA